MPGRLVPPIATARSKYPVRVHSASLGNTPYTRSDLAKAVENFNRYQAAADPRFTNPKLLYIPAAQIGVGHEDDQAFAKALSERTDLPSSGRPDKVWLLGNDLWATFADMPLPLAAMANAGQFSEVSAEIYPDYVTADGRHHGPVIKRFSLLGAAPPRQKGLNPGGLPPFVYSEPAARGRPAQNVAITFSEYRPMNRDEALQILTAAGIDPATFAGANDALLIAFATAVKGGPAPTNTPPPPVVSFAEFGNQVRRDMAAIVAPVLSRMVDMQKSFGDITAENVKQSCETFAEAHKDRLFPYEADPKNGAYIVTRLVQMTPDARKAEMAAILNRPSLTKFNESMPEGGAGGTGQGHTRIERPAGSGGAMSGERRRELLSTTPRGRAILKTSDAANRN
jgi:hypothetical protein